MAERRALETRYESLYRMTIKRGGRGLFILKPRRDWSCFLLPALLLLEQGLGFSSMQRLVRRRCELCQLRWCSDGMHPITKMITRASFPAVSSIREEACVHRLRARRRVVLLLASPPKAAGEEKRDDAYGRECRDNIEFSSTKAAKEGPERNSTMAALPQDTWAPFPMPNRAGIETFIKSPLTELGLSFLVSLSCFLFALQTCDGMMGGQPGGVDLGEPMLSFIDRTEYCIGIVFVVEYIMRWYYQVSFLCPIVLESAMQSFNCFATDGGRRGGLEIRTDEHTTELNFSSVTYLRLCDILCRGFRSAICFRHSWRSIWWLCFQPCFASCPYRWDSAALALNSSACFVSFAFNGFSIMYVTARFQTDKVTMTCKRGVTFHLRAWLQR